MNRRQILTAGSATMMGLLAGCGGGQDGTTETTEGSPGGETGQTDTGGDSGVVEDRFDFVRGRPATQIQMNPFSTQNYGRTFAILWGVGTFVATSDGTIEPVMAEEITTDGKEVTTKIPEDWTFWSGEDITARDYLVSSEIRRLQDPEASQVESHEVVDEYTFKRRFKSRRTPYLARSRPTGGVVPKSVYEEYYERYDEATTQEERNAVTNDLTSFTISVEEYMEDGLGFGMYKLDEFNSQLAEGILWEDHPWSDRANIPRVRVYNRNVEEKTMAKNGDLDRMMGGIRESERDQYPDTMQNVDTLEWYRTQKLTLNWSNEHLANINVRRALMAAMPLDSMSQTAFESGYNCNPTQVQTGLRSAIHEQYLGEDFVDQLIQYPVESDLDAAREYMRQAGYTEEGGNWVSPDGTTPEFNILTRTVQGSNLPVQIFSDALSQLGIETEINAIGSDYYTTIQNWEFDIAWIWHVATADWHPVAYFSNNFFGLKVGDPTKTEGTGPTGIPFTYEIPGTVGSEEIGDNPEEIQPAVLCRDLPSSQSLEEVREKTRTLSWFWNYSLPGIVYIQENQTRAMDIGNFAWPKEPENHPLNVTNFVQNGFFWGEVQGRTE